MTTLAAAVYLSGLPGEHFTEELENLYSIALNNLDSPNSLKNCWASSSSFSGFSSISLESLCPSSTDDGSGGCSSIDSGYIGFPWSCVSEYTAYPVASIAESAYSGYPPSDESSADAIFDMLDNRILEDVIETLRVQEIRDLAQEFLSVIDEIETRYYGREEVRNAETWKCLSTLSVFGGPNSNDSKIVYQGRNILNLFENISTDWKPSYADTNLTEEQQYVDVINKCISELSCDNVDTYELLKDFTTDWPSQELF